MAMVGVFGVYRPDATLDELVGLIQEVRPEIRKARNCRLSLSLVYVDLVRPCVAP